MKIGKCRQNTPILKSSARKTELGKDQFPSAVSFYSSFHWINHKFTKHKTVNRCTVEVFDLSNWEKEIIESVESVKDDNGSQQEIKTSKVRFWPVASESIRLLLAKEIIVHTKDGNIDIFHSRFNKWNFLSCIAPRNKIVAVINGTIGYDGHICEGGEPKGSRKELKFKLTCNIKSTYEDEKVKSIEIFSYNTKIYVNKIFILKNTCNLNYFKTIQ